MIAEMFRTLGLHTTFQMHMRNLILGVSENIEGTQTSQGGGMAQWEWNS